MSRCQLGNYEVLGMETILSPLQGFCRGKFYNVNEEND